MCQISACRLTKHVSFLLLSTILSCASVSAIGQEDEEAKVGMANPTTRLENDGDAILEADAQDLAPAVDREAGKLQAIDEAAVTYQDEGSEAALTEEKVETATPLSEEVEDLKKAALELNRDLLILEEELLFPANSQIVVFLSLDVGEYFALDSVKVLIDDKLVASHLYTKRQNTALSLGGIQRLYLGNLKSGDHEVTAFFVGVGPENREYKRGATIVINKDDDPKLLELKVRDSTANMQPEFEFEEWQL